jgi:tetratricopeptide (TPR) repeat protein
MSESEATRIERLVREGLDCFGEGEVARAIACWEEVLRLDPHHAQALDYLGAARAGEDAGQEDEEFEFAEPGSGATSSERQERSLEALLSAAQGLLRKQDLEGALALFETAAEMDPRRIEIEGYIDMVRSRLLKAYRERVGGGQTVPRLLVDLAEVTRYNLHTDAGFLLSLLDGATSVEDLVSLSGMDAFDALRILNNLIDAGIVGSGT